jgi:hypothetical protein
MMKNIGLILSMFLLLTACDDGELEAEYPVDLEQRRVNERGKITGTVTKAVLAHRLASIAICGALHWIPSPAFLYRRLTRSAALC